MQTIESLKRNIQSAQDLLGVVKTMKALAAVSIRQYQKAVESLSEYNRTVEMGLQVVLKRSRGSFAPMRSASASVSPPSGISSTATSSIRRASTRAMVVRIGGAWSARNQWQALSSRLSSQ